MVLIGLGATTVPGVILIAYSMIITEGLQTLMLCTGKWVPVLAETIYEEIKLRLHINCLYFPQGQKYIFNSVRQNFFETPICDRIITMLVKSAILIGLSLVN